MGETEETEMFLSRYPSEPLTRPRWPARHGEPREWWIVPDSQPTSAEPEMVHRGSAVVPSADPEFVFVVEWTGTTVRQHRVRVTPRTPRRGGR